MVALDPRNPSAHNNLGNLLRQVGRDYGVKAEVPDVEIVGDPGRLTQVFVNLVANAVRVCGSPDKVHLELHMRPGEAEALVIDTGAGVPDHIKPKIFDKFYRGKEAGSAGLGLTIAKMLTDLMGGELTVSSIVGTGTLFRIRLFLPAAHDAAAAPRPVPQARHGYEGRRRRILVVDNEEADRELLVRLLEPLGFEKVVRTPGSFTAGPGPVTLSLPGGVLAGLLVCYEVIFPGAVAPTPSLM